MKNYAKYFITALAAVAMLSWGTGAQAISVKISDGITTKTCADGDGGCDLISSPGVVGLSAVNLGNFIVSLAVGSTYPALGSASSPNIDLLSLALSGGSGTLTFWASAQDYTGPLTS